jgi:hypothetical protein
MSGKKEGTERRILTEMQFENTLKGQVAIVTGAGHWQGDCKGLCRSGRFGLLRGAHGE